ncbi:MAG TPA: flagellar basal-body rod protein FlgF [Desulfocapsa sulfexigens]|nr:flagellar basal-body rod protein FlgF [Desulfocapsa sulfexigens]HIQ36391.1 flagellar basal-body rod protein FlgF [Desulfocapsa sulfexigens]
MGSGKYSALAGAISREQRLANIATNLANVNTIGYKKSRMSFESLLRGEQQTNRAKGINYSRVRENFTEFTEGPIRGTGNPLDIAIYGDGFFKVQSPDGTRYTRRGDFHTAQDGTLLTGNNMPVLDNGNAPILIPDTDTSKISVNSLGEVSILSIDGTRNVVGTIAIYTINDNKNLTREPDTLFSLKEDGQEILQEKPNLAVGSLEVSNVNITEEMALMIESTRTFESYQKVIKAYSTLGKKQDELGTIG